jgi:hypothetical protein
LLQKLDATLNFLKNTKRIANHLKDAKLRRYVPPAVPKANEAKLDSIMAGLAGTPNFPGRNVKPLKITKKNGMWRFIFQDDGAVKALTEKNLLKTVPYLYLASDSPRVALEAFHNEMASWYNRYPFPIPEGSLLPRLFQSMILSRLNSRHPEISDTYLDGHAYGITIFFVDSDTGEVKEAFTKASATDKYMQKVQVPPLPHIYLRAYKGKETSTLIGPSTAALYPRAPSKLKKTSEKSQHLAVDSLRWISLQLTGTVCSVARMNDLINLHRQRIGLVARVSKGIYGNESRLCNHTVFKLSSKTTVTPSIRLTRDIGGSPHDKLGFRDITLIGNRLAIDVHSMNASRVTPVLETALQLYCAGMDPRMMWIETATIADQVNLDISEGVPPSSQCDCDDMHATTELHPCGGCGEHAICQARKFDSLNRLVCPRCHARDEAAIADDELGNLNKLMVVNSLKRSFRRESRIRQMDYKSEPAKTILQDALSDPRLEVPADAVSFVDTYTQILYNDLGAEKGAIGKNPSRRRLIPHQPTVDAVRPRGAPEHSAFKHSRGNLEITTVTCNMAKGRYLPGVLHEIAKFCDNPSSQNRAHLIDTIHNITLVMLKERSTHSATSESPADGYDELVAEMLCGKPIVGEMGPWDTHALRYTANLVPPLKEGRNLWDDATFTRLQKCAQSISDFFGVDLHTLSDGTLWVGDALTCPLDLNRNGIAILCIERLLRMRLVCNKKWETHDTDETLYMEIIFQYCASHTQKPDLVSWQKKYGDRLGLPLIIFWNSPLRMSVAHREHGFGMSTGWPTTVPPTDVQQRINNDTVDDGTGNNMLIESWYVNSAKQDLAEEYYDKMDHILKSVKLPKHCYDPEKLPPTGRSVPVGSSTHEIDAVDSFEGEGFDETVENEPEEAMSPPPQGPSTAGQELAGPEVADPESAAPEPAASEPVAPESTVLESAGPQVAGSQVAVAGGTSAEGAGASPEHDNSRPPAEDVRNILQELSREILATTAYHEIFLANSELFVLLGQAHKYMQEGKSDEAYDVVMNLQQSLATISSLE